MRRLVTMLLFTATLIAQSGTLVQGTIYTAFTGEKFTGRLHLTGQPYTSTDGRYVAGWEKDYTVTNGVFSARLDADGQATIRVDLYPSAGHGLSSTENWLVPVSTTPVSLAVVRWPAVMAPTNVVSWGQLLGMGMTWGQILTMSGR